jgi:LPXTG-motif cell wall-anchored protein
VTTWPLVAGLGLLALGIGGLWWARRRARSVTTPVSQAWLASHDYGKGGDDRQWK